MKKLYQIQLISSGNHRTVYIRADDMLQSVRMIQRRMNGIKILKIEPIGRDGHMTDQNIIIVCPNMMQADWAWNDFCKRYWSIINKAQRHPLRVILFNGCTVYFKSEKLGERYDLGLKAKVITMDEFEMWEVSDGISI